MKIDLTALPRDAQIRHVIAVLAQRVAHRAPSDKTLYASDLMTRFKHRSLATRNERLAYFSQLQREAVAEMLAGARKQAAAAEAAAAPAS